MSSKHTHFIGIGGIGISALAFKALAEGHAVSGSDQSDSALIQDLKSEGAQIHIGHGNLPDSVTQVIYTEAIDKKTNPEYLEAQSRSLPTQSYFEALGELSQSKKTVAIVGTHGKTTTTAMLGISLADAGLDPTVIVGSKVREFKGRNIRFGKSDILVAEGCEYRRSFLSLNPHALVLLNCEWEHMDYYKTEDDYLKAYRELIDKLPSDGFLVANAEDDNVKKLTQDFSGEIIWISQKDTDLFNWEMQIPGEFNKLNAMHAYETAMRLGANGSEIRNSLESFKGTWRRLEVKGEKDGVLVVDDYGHHPTEVRLTLHALKQKYPQKKLICVFQPHQYSRTAELLDEFAGAFEDASQVLIPNIYEARDTDEAKSKVSAESLAAKIPNATHTQSFKKTLEILKSTAKSGDLIVTMGAGNIGEIADQYLI